LLLAEDHRRGAKDVNRRQPLHHDQGREMENSQPSLGILRVAEGDGYPYVLQR
jgi:hypothetical protein